MNFEGNDKYNGAYDSLACTVEKLDTNVDVNNPEINVGDDAVITITVDFDATGSVLIDNTYYAVISEGSATVAIPNLANGTYTYTVVYSGDEKYNRKETTVTVTVNKIATAPMVNVDDIELGQDAVITVADLPSDATGTITITVTGMEPKVITIGETYTISNLANGTYTVEAIYSGDGKYEAGTASETFTVKYVEQVNDTAVTDITDLNTDSKDISISLPADATGTLTVSVDGKATTVDVVNGTASVPVNLTAGNHDIAVTYSGDGKYSSFTKESSVEVPKATSAVTPSVPESVTAGKTSTITITLAGDATGIVLVDVDGKKFYGEVVNGTANVEVTGLTVGDKEVKYTYLGDAKYNPYSGSFNMTVTTTPKITASTLNMFYYDGSVFKVRVYGTDAQPVSSGKVTFTINNKKYTRSIDKNGYASLKITDLPKKYTATAQYGDVKISKTINVKQILKSKNVAVKTTAKTLVLQATLAKVNGKFLKNKVITFKFNGKKYSAKTDAKGIAKVTIKQNIIKKLKAGKKYTFTVTYVKDTIKQKP